MTVTLLSICCTRIVIKFYCLAVFFSTTCFTHFFYNRSLVFSCLWQLFINEYDDDDRRFDISQ